MATGEGEGMVWYTVCSCRRRGSNLMMMEMNGEANRRHSMLCQVTMLTTSNLSKEGVMDTELY